MKKKTVLIIAFVLIFSLLLGSCSLFKRIVTPDDEAESEKIMAAVTGGLDLDSLSLDELLELYDEFLEGDDAVNDGAEYDLYYRGAANGSKDPFAELDVDRAEGATVAVVTDEAWVTDKEFEALDPTANMSAEDKAGYNAMMKELEDFDADEFQRGIDEMLAGFEGFEDLDSDPDDSYPDDSDPDDSEPAILNEWPDNAITRQVPKPPFADPMIVADDESVTCMATGTSKKDAEDYVKKLKAAGFTHDAYEDEQEVGGMTVIYTFTAKNGGGVTVSLTFTGGMTTVVVNKG